MKIVRQHPDARSRRRADFSAVRPPYSTFAEEAAASVERMARSVDFPAPFGPSRPTISPARQSSDTRDSARRRPKFRLSSRMERSRKSALTRRR